ncbi:putative acetyltransferase (GNAT) family protein [Roseibacterium elongatum DSM 19469]|uniref:Putative acetyltransferase (GNAT) family protein n=1 Tax=Roseicyclus elongatus DSM 19469 TaxID=1294273 RepID=W8S2L9_9RHOB|nr:GNAT family N-acetyltransferase [Roseibacterium elongatum]AHM04417.1 putative acetyltransferase (GNAT) family protein [Roseibacterium elongatum DSM 19469]
MLPEIKIRPTTAADMAAIDALLSESYPVLLGGDYTAEVLETTLPVIARARPELLRCGSYYVAEDAGGRALAAGGWTHGGPQGDVGPRDVAHIRHVVTHPEATRRGLGSAILEHCFDKARAQGITWLLCQSTRSAVPFYRTMGFEDRAEIDITLEPGVTFPAVEMARVL